jgi:hypothetical protein
MPFGLGFFATAGAGGAAGSFDLLESQVLGSTAASVTFSSLSTYASTYQHLQIRMVARASRSGATTDPLIVKLNSTTQTYGHHLFGNGSSVGSGNIATSYSLLDAITGATAATNAFGACVIDILDPFETTKNKTIRALTGANTVVSLSSTFWNFTTAVSSIELSAFSATNFLVGSRFSLYGWKAT